MKKTDITKECALFCENLGKVTNGTFWHRREENGERGEAVPLPVILQGKIFRFWAVWPVERCRRLRRFAWMRILFKRQTLRWFDERVRNVLGVQQTSYAGRVVGTSAGSLASAFGESSLSTLCLLSPPNPLRWASAGTPELPGRKIKRPAGRQRRAVPCLP